MKCIPLKEFTPAPSMEYVATAYPGPGAYLLPSGNVVFVSAVSTCMSIMPPYLPRIEDQVPAAAQSPTPSVEVHRLLDQLIELRR